MGRSLCSARTVWKAAGRSVARVELHYCRQAGLRPEPAPARLLELVPTPYGTAGAEALSVFSNCEPEVIRKQPGNQRLFPLCFDRKNRHVETGGAAWSNPVSPGWTPPVYPRVFLGRYHRASPAISVLRDVFSPRFGPPAHRRHQETCGRNEKKTPVIVPCVFHDGCRRPAPAIWASPIIPCCQTETSRGRREEEPLRGSRSVSQSSNPPVILISSDEKRRQSPLRILLLLSAIRDDQDAFATERHHRTHPRVGRNKQELENGT